MQIFHAILQATYDLRSLSNHCYTYWLFQLYDAEGEEIMSEWTEETLSLIQQDIKSFSVPFLG